MIRATVSLDEAIMDMNRRGLKSRIVVDGNGRLAGMLTLENVTEMMMIHRSGPNGNSRRSIQEEYGVPLQGPSPSTAGLATLSVLLLVGALPVLPFLVPFLSGGGYFVASARVTLRALFALLM